MATNDTITITKADLAAMMEETVAEALAAAKAPTEATFEITGRVTKVLWKTERGTGLAVAVDGSPKDLVVSVDGSREVATKALVQASGTISASSSKKDGVWVNYTNLRAEQFTVLG